MREPSRDVRKWLFRTLLVAAHGLLLHAAPAHAEDAETRTAARDLATQGGQAFDAGQYEQASDFFLRAYELVHAPSIALMRARSLAKVGKLLEAIDVYEQTARVKLPAGAPEAYVKAVETAKDEVEEVRRRMPRLKLTLTSSAANQTPAVTIDGKPTPAALLGVDRPINPGLHRVAVLVSGKARSTRELELEEGKSYSFELAFAPEVAPEPEAVVTPKNRLASPVPPAPDAPPGTSSSTARGMSTTRSLGYVGVGVGVVGLGVGTYTGLVALQHESRLEDVCHPGCPQSSAGDLSGFRSNRTVSWVSFGVGIAAASTGIVLLTLGNSKREQLTLRALPGGLQIGGKL